MFFGVDLRKTLKELMRRTVSVKDYVMHMNEPFRDRFLERMKAYSLKEDVAEEMKKYVDEISVVVYPVVGWLFLPVFGWLLAVLVGWLD
jgi:hypothetical protein